MDLSPPSVGFFLPDNFSKGRLLTDNPALIATCIRL